MESVCESMNPRCVRTLMEKHGARYPVTGRAAIAERAPLRDYTGLEKSAALQALRGGAKPGKVAAFLNLHASAVRRWSREAGIRFRQHRGVRIDHAPEVIEAACWMLVGGERPMSVARKLNLQFSTVAGWSQRLGLRWRNTEETAA